MIEVIRRWPAGESTRSIVKASRVALNTVDKYLRLAKASGLESDGQPPGDEVITQLAWDGGSGRKERHSSLRGATASRSGSRTSVCS